MMPWKVNHNTKRIENSPGRRSLLSTSLGKTWPNRAAEKDSRRGCTTDNSLTPRIYIRSYSRWIFTDVYRLHNAPLNNVEYDIAWPYSRYQFAAYWLYSWRQESFSIKQTQREPRYQNHSTSFNILKCEEASESKDFHGHTRHWGGMLHPQPAGQWYKCQVRVKR